MGKKFLKPVPVLIATLLAAGAFASGGSSVEAANLVSKRETEQASENRQLLLQPADSDETVFLGHRSHSSHASHASHHSHYSGFVGE